MAEAVVTASAPFIIRLNEEGTYLLNVQPDAAALTKLAADGVVFWSKKAIERRGRFHMALSGGSTPKALFELLASAHYAPQIFWERVHVWWGDERDVPATHVDSNYKMAHDALLGKVPIPPANIHRVRCELGVEHAAAHYETEIKFAFNVIKIDEETGAILDGAGWPVFDLVLLGMGDDGHTASLFPETDLLDETLRLVSSHFVEKVGMRRVTFTTPLINAADSVIFLVSGASKAAMLKNVLLGELQPKRWPAQLITPVGKLFWMTDAAAAAQVATGPVYPEGEFIYRRGDESPKPA
jgi:6-phosphogluconolactonase